MKFLRDMLIVTASAFVALPVWAAIEIAEGVGYLPGAAPDASICTWETGMVPTAVAKSKGAIKLAGNTSAPPNPKLSLQVAQLKLSRTAKGGEYVAVVRGDVVLDGKLLATRDFQDEGSFKSEPQACDALRATAASLGESAADWASQTQFMACAQDCVGIHPDEPIAVGTRVLLVTDDAINATVRDDCRFQTVMVGKLVSAFNEGDPPPRAKLAPGTVDIEKHAGRRLLLRVNNVHAVGGGGFTGPKWMEMSGELWDGKNLVADFRSYTSSGRGLTTCRSVDSLSDSTADLIARWLQSPSLGAYLR